MQGGWVYRKNSYARDFSKAAISDVCAPLVWRKFDPKIHPRRCFVCCLTCYQVYSTGTSFTHTLAVGYLNRE